MVDKKTECAAVMNVIKQAGSLVSSVEFIDLYENEKLGFGKKSLTFAVHFASRTENVTDALADEQMAAILAQLDEKLGIKIRS